MIHDERDLESWNLVLLFFIVSLAFSARWALLPCSRPSAARNALGTIGDFRRRSDIKQVSLVILIYTES